MEYLDVKQGAACTYPKTPHLSEVKNRDVASILDAYGGPDRAHEQELDNYHRLVIDAAYRLRANDLTTFEYRAGWGSSTSWVDPNSGGSLTVWHDGRLS